MRIKLDKDAFEATHWDMRASFSFLQVDLYLIMDLRCPLRALLDWQSWSRGGVPDLGHQCLILGKEAKMGGRDRSRYGVGQKKILISYGALSFFSEIIPSCPNI